MIDVITKLREIAARSPEEIGRAIAAAEAMSGKPVTEEMSEKQKKFFGGGKKDDDKDDEKKTDSKGKKPDFLDMDKDGDKEEPMSKAIKDKEEKKKVDEDISITLTGSDAVLAEILKLAGQIGAKTTKGSEPGMPPAIGGDLGGSLAPPPVPAVMPPKPMGMPSTGPIPSLSSMLGDKPDMDDMGGMDEPNMDGPGGMDDMGIDMELDGPGDDMDDESMDDTMMDSAFDATTTPSPTTMGLGAAIPSGNDLAKPKMTAPKVSSGDNPFRRSVSFD